jgi:hypothetical protein
MEPSVLGQAIMEGGPDRKIKLDHSAGLDEVLPILLVVYYFRSLGLLFTTYSIITRYRSFLTCPLPLLSYTSRGTYKLCWKSCINKNTFVSGWLMTR